MDAPEDWPAGSAGYASASLDRYHHDLLTSPVDEKVVLGLASVVFWGFSSGGDGRLTYPRALARARQVLFGKAGEEPDPSQRLHDAVRLAAAHAGESRMAEALAAVRDLKMFGVSFASKVIAFLNPQGAGVCDRLIADGLQRSGSRLYFSPGFSAGSSAKAAQEKGFQAWCTECRIQAEKLRKAGSSWQDWDGSHHEWRAVDVERALFARFAEMRTAP